MDTTQLIISSEYRKPGNVRNHIVVTLSFQIFFQGNCMGCFPIQNKQPWLSVVYVFMCCAYILQVDIETFQLVSTLIAQ
jgi:hypothetical protein